MNHSRPERPRGLPTRIGSSRVAARVHRSNNAADHLETLDRSLAQLPVAANEVEMLVRTDSAGATQEFVDGCRDRGVRFSIGLPVDQRVRDSLLLAQEEDWIPAVERDDQARDGAWVIELTDLIDFDN